MGLANQKLGPVSLMKSGHLRHQVQFPKFLKFQLHPQTDVGVLRIKMSSLRRRILGPSSNSTPDSTELSRDPSPAKGEPVTLIPDSQLKKLKSKKSKRRQGLIFGLGGLFGLLVAAFFANQHDVINLEGLVDINLESLMDVIPAGIVKDAKDLTVRKTHVHFRTAMT